MADVIEIRKDVRLKVQLFWNDLKDKDVSIPNKISMIMDAGTDIVEAFSDVLAGGERLRLAATEVNRVLDVRWIPEPIEQKLIEFAMSAIVNVKNKHLGKDWGKKIAAAVSKPAAPESPDVN